MKSMWMTAGAFGVATAALAGCGGDNTTSVTVQPKVGTIQGQDDGPQTCMYVSNQGAQDWITANCSNGGHYSYDNGDPNSSRCVSCVLGGGSSSGPGYSGSGGYEPGNGGGGEPTGDTPTNGGGGSQPPTTTPPNPPADDPPKVDVEKTKFLCTCCESDIQWVGSVNVANSTDCGGAGLVACAPFGDHPRDIDNFAANEDQLGKSGSFTKWAVAPTTTDWLGNDHTVTTFWSHMDDGDSVRFFSDLIDYKNDGMLGEIAGILPVVWEATAIIEATKVLSSISTRDLLAAYNAAGLKNGIYVLAEEDWEELNPGGDHYTNGKMNFTYSIYLRDTGTLLGTVTGSDPANGPGGHIAEQNIDGNLAMPPAQFQTDASATTGQKCGEEINQSQQPSQPNPECANQGGWSYDPSCNRPPSQNQN